jgi:hypothetical protein
MNEWQSPDAGTLRISNPITLQRWIDLGWYKETINKGYFFAVYCGRFRTEICNCSACRSKRTDKSELINLIKQATK